MLSLFGVGVYNVSAASPVRPISRFATQACRDSLALFLRRAFGAAFLRARRFCARQREQLDEVERRHCFWSIACSLASSAMRSKPAATTIICSFSSGSEIISQSARTSFACSRQRVTSHSTDVICFHSEHTFGTVCFRCRLPRARHSPLSSAGRHDQVRLRL